MIRAFEIFGLPGSGKSTQRKILMKKYQLSDLSSGEVIREKAQEDSKLGKEIKKRFELGEPQPDNLAIRLIYNYLKDFDFKRGIIFDNFPFNAVQMEQYIKRIESEYKLVPLVGILLDIDPLVIIDRLTQRLFCPKCYQVYIKSELVEKDLICPKCKVKLKQRKDDQLEIVKERVTNYLEPIQYLKKYFKKQNRLIEVNGNQPIKAVAKAIDQQIREVVND